ncbi:MAG: LamG domain-containing protein [Candidatus Marsarchaeota archaeon]|jgi:hypothetical protein|nr:LamG domain-containing protein [Candidatus Marsarchaeota archaeon]
MSILRNYKNKNNCKKIKNKKSAQSAMEYLMTYGWAILIIAVVLVVLFHMGLFNTNIGPKASPGSCKVIRPDGPGTIPYIGLQGASCNGKLPQYVMEIVEPPVNGIPAYIKVQNNPALTITPEENLTISSWVNIISTRSGFINDFLDIGFDASYCEGEIRDSYGAFQMVRGSNQEMYFGPQLGKWYNYIGIYSYNGISGNVYLYVNGTYVGGGPAGTCTATTRNVIIGEVGSIGALNETLISNVQIYNTSLSTNDIQALYQEGIGGAPIDLNHLAGWWPLNGNANDYSGNGNNGVPNNINFASSWQNGYTAP